MIFGFVLPPPPKPNPGYALGLSQMEGSFRPSMVICELSSSTMPPLPSDTAVGPVSGFRALCMYPISQA